MSFFQATVSKKYANNINKEVLKTAYSVFRSHFHNADIQENIRNSKEEQYQEGFFRDLFVKVLGYKQNPEPNFNLITEKKNEKDSKKSDGAIIINGIVTAVIELKGTDTTDLAKIETQAFGYKNNQANCTYVITSNFEKLWFYIDNAIDHLEFNLFTLTEAEFELLYLCLSFETIQANIPQKIKAESLSEEDNITKKLYKDYSLFKRELHQNLVQLNPEFDALTLFKKSQKLLDRFLFLFFAEDRNLLPPNSVRLVLNDWRDIQDRDEHTPLYSRFKKYFGYLNTGFKGKRYDVFAYNGGLFKPDELLDAISIDDELLFRHTHKLSEYNFESEVDVNILGHIFENSLNELDEIQAQLEGQEIEKSKTKRKKDGVFYTPKYITKYIVENTVGKLCIDKKAELELKDEDFVKKTGKARGPFFDKLKNYREWLLQLTICDPACGSGAFLNQALDFLINEHKYLDELQAKLFGDAILLNDVSKSILENNLFGVDLNEESVEIAKLSLWLRTAQPNRKLNDLNSNIKCGNSLIDDPEIAGEKAFNWNEEFPQVFDKGGFDVIIGNPPYVKLETNKILSEQISKLGYETFEKRGDLYVLFVEKGFGIVKTRGIVSYIMPNKWLQAEYGKSLRSYFLKFQMNQLIDFGDLQIFEGATTYPCIFISEKKDPSDYIPISVLKSEMKNDFDFNIHQNTQIFPIGSFNEQTWVISSNSDKELLTKLQNQLLTLEDYINGDAYYGVKTGLSEAFFINELTKNEIINSDYNAKNYIFPFVQGRNISRYCPLKIENYLIGTFPAFKLDIENIQGIKNHLLKFGIQRLEQSGEKGSRKKTTNKWFETSDSINYYEFFSKPKIMFQTFQVKPCFIYDELGLYCNNSMWIIPTENKALLGVLNSKMGWWLISKFCTQIQNGYQLIWKYFGQIPVPSTNQELTSLVETILFQNKNLQEQSQKFQRTLQRKFELTELSTKLENWYSLTYKEFIAELAKKKIKLSLAEEAEWEGYFSVEAQKAQSIKAEIDKTDKEIDAMVYQLYGLTEEEIKIVEGN
ncbi:restriction endonuclease subunit M [Lacihabitans sp. LS3-19]|uniref:Eco57I restriction-modification methylase domain-containing protein n=1 Tax=Lacihabitans sp. LS3-19 TaxID=2487335 RepID=UPI0020CDAEA9|nr:DNA methyltransferase [Lacihabitans sp. LS3-19]MCP9770482.1 restriction endonuclease subunit M [Lacihabitans sp. LS3-19]